MEVDLQAPPEVSCTRTGVAEMVVPSEYRSRVSFDSRDWSQV